MASTYLQKYDLPGGFQDFLSELVRETLRAQPDDIIEFLANYCEARANGKTYDYDSIFVKENQQRERVIENQPPKEHYKDITNRAKLLVQQSNQQPVQLKPIIKNTRTSVMDDIPDPQGWEPHKEAYSEMQKKKELENKKINYQQHEMQPSSKTSAYQKLKMQQQQQDNEYNNEQNYNDQQYDQQQQTEENQYIQYDNNNNQNNNNIAGQQQYNQNQQYQQYQFRQKDDSNMNIYQSEKSQSQSRQQSAASQGNVSNTTSHPEEKGVSKQFMGDLYNSALNQISQDNNNNQEYQQAAQYIDNRYNQLQEQEEEHEEDEQDDEQGNYQEGEQEEEDDDKDNEEQ